MKNKLITVEEWLAELEKAGKENKEGLSVEDISYATGLRKETVREKLRRAVKEGFCEFAGFRSGTNIIGHSMQVPIYRLVIKDKQEKQEPKYASKKTTKKTSKRTAKAAKKK